MGKKHKKHHKSEKKSHDGLFFSLFANTRDTTLSMFLIQDTNIHVTYTIMNLGLPMRAEH